MIIVKKSRHGFPYSYVWFAAAPKPQHAFGFYFYAQCARVGPQAGFVRRSFLTKIVDLRACEATLLKGMSRRGAQDVKRAKREGVALQVIAGPEQFVPFFNAFARGKGFHLIEADELAGWGRDIVGVAAMADGEPLAMHTYLVDRDTSRARLLHSASLFRAAASNDERAAIGRANRLLHYEAMLHFKAAGLASYDLGGYAKDSSDPQLLNIAKFKDTLGGDEVREDHFISLPLHALLSCNACIGAARSLWFDRVVSPWRGARMRLMAALMRDPAAAGSADQGR